MDKVLIIDDESDVLYAFRRIFEGSDLDILSADNGREGFRIFRERAPRLVILDIRMEGWSGLHTLERIREVDGRTPVILMTAYGTSKTAIEAMKRGAWDYLLKPFDIPRLKEVVHSALRSSRDMQESVRLEDPADDGIGIVGKSEPMQRIFKLIGQLASSSATVLVTGESGTGKELAARAIYQNSERSGQPYLAINCAAIPENLLESELFGHEKGAFTGAHTLRIGKFEQCHHGTIFLDEIGDMALSTQTRILRVLQNGTFERVGGNRSIKVDVRIIAGTNRDLERAVEENAFREDLFYRLNVVRLHMPPLRERGEDIRPLVSYFLGKANARKGTGRKTISSEALESLENHDWPGNVRELENTLQRAMVIAKGDVILAGDLPLKVRGPRSPALDPHREPAPPESSGLPELAERLFSWAERTTGERLLPVLERELIRLALERTGGNQIRASALLGIGRGTLRRRMEKYRLHVRQRIEDSSSVQPPVRSPTPSAPG